MKKKVLIAGLSLFTASMITLSACKKENGEGSGSMSIHMTDAPGDYLQVNVDVKSVEVHHEHSGWVALPTRDSIYNLLDLQNNVSTVLSDPKDMPLGKITQLRLILGPNNTIMTKDSVVHDLQTPSAQQSGLKINLNTDIRSNQEVNIRLDFDADKSVVEQGNGGYSLKPVISVDSVWTK